MAKMGRPKSENPKKNLIGLKLTEEETEALEKINFTGTKILGFILNDSIENKSGYYSKRRYHSRLGSYYNRYYNGYYSGYYGYYGRSADQQGSTEKGKK